MNNSSHGDSSAALTRPVISYAQASKAINAAMVFAKERGLQLSIVVLDAGGHVVASARMDGAGFVTIEVARGKAFAVAATGGTPGDALARRYAENPMVWGNVASLGYGAPLLPARGSLPIYKDGALIGAIAASGAPSEQDELAILAGIAAIDATDTPQ
ncbi:GlcG/HbpS family heme-binding protein [Paraburkholderia oxyphila]|uniref:GlcG/HbpS family heme-binding protein n=1 Tax=Paraburkholderia oxyphila TaxID=614212 RepID=UPI000483511D|nr:heme-binding protein [Paraburkholderia oxyphila]